jgi:hypothetical protein
MPERPTARTCDGCDLCCRLYDIDELAKPAGALCAHAQGLRCTIHGAHPRTCSAYRCHWLNAPDLGPEWRPSTAGFALRLDSDGVAMWVDVDPERPGAWRREPYYGQIKRWSGAIRRSAGVVLVHDGPGVFVIFPEAELYIHSPPPGARFEAGYRAGIGGARPWARVLEDREHQAAA